MSATLPIHRLRQRLLILSLGILSIVTIVTVRLFHIQLLDGEAYKIMAEQNRLFTVSVAQSRAVFFDRYQQPLVMNSPEYALIEDSQALYTNSIPVSREQALQALATNSAVVTYRYARHYLYPHALSHVLGFVGPVTADDLKKDDALGFQDLIGKSGLERAFDNTIRGVSSKETYEIDALGKRRRLVSEEPAQLGESVTLSVDPVITEIARVAMAGQTGAIVILDSHTGDIISMVSYPDFDSNALIPVQNDPAAEKTRKQLVQSWFTDERQVFFNRAISGEYPPGSVFKIVTAAAGLDAGAIDPQTTVLDEGILKVGEYSYGNWYYSQFGGVDGHIGVQRALARSNDIFFYKTAEWTGPTKVAEMARLFGYGRATDVELSSERTGLVPDPIWKEEVKGEKWYLGNTYHYGIGQGDTLVTPLQVAQATQLVANRGTRCRPTFIKANMECQEVGVKEEYLNIVLNGMLDACSPGGTSGQFFDRNNQVLTELGSSPGDQNRDAFAALKQGMVACKTGTAEFGAANERGRRRTHGWFTAVGGVRLGQTEFPQQTNEDQLASAAAQLTDQVKKEQLQHQILNTLQTQPVDYAHLHQLWKQTIGNSFPEELVFAVVVESSEDVPFREGSTHAAPVVKRIMSWIENGKNPSQENTSVQEKSE